MSTEGPYDVADADTSAGTGPVVVDCTTPDGLAAGVEAASRAVRAGQVVVLPTDTVYGIGADAFDAAAVAAVLAAKGRGRDMPPPVLVPNVRTVDGLAREIPDDARALIAAFWPGALTLVLRAQPSLSWDLGETNGTVAVRMPDDATALDLLATIGPMAVTSANATGHPPALTVAEAQEMLGDAVAVYLDGGPAKVGEASTILDCTGEEVRTLREGAISREQVDAALEAGRERRAQEAAEAARLEEAAAKAAKRAELAAMRGGKGVGRPKKPATPSAGPRQGRVAGRRHDA
ncbi:L-threonylcarbamoyladenylate synthase [Lapillicoccus jejuensis]|uniref:L-threonylcarbamoyladenylate synthase n=1 Tax=Lapillicoccus jejuensis TaxID=402171 RepID=A0A542E301_9MICO|nr:L-threonylcarbamoyladenylate synthase [Lapillicoccus jejuensis]TQJ09614.1 translation factor SUA5 [Lapillicoccus jejuensis]